MNHEIPGPVPAGVTHSALGAGAFVSKWTINKNTLQVLSGGDLITSTQYSNANGVATPTSLQRLCSADLAPISAWFNAATGLGYNGRIFMDGEETTDGRALANVVTSGTSYQLNLFGRQAWENLLANPGTGNKTVVIGNDDTSGTGNGQVLVYAGDKQATGSDIDKAGLTNGKLYAIQVQGTSQESRTPAPGALGNKGVALNFGLVEVPNPGTLTTTATTDTALTAAGATAFLRPEDGAWNPANANQYFFVTTDRYDQVKDGVGAQVARTRLWQVDFVDASNPTLGGTIKAVLDGTEAGNMWDNLTITADGKILLEEDVGNEQHNGKIYMFDPVTGELKLMFKHDATLFGDIGAPGTKTQDEEGSGIIDVTSLFADASWYVGGKIFLTSDQAHNARTDTVEDGQLLLLAVATPEPVGLALMGPALAGLYLRRRRTTRV
jgi:hypothetical protein